MTTTKWMLSVFAALALTVQSSRASELFYLNCEAVITRAQLAGNSLDEYPYFEYVKAFNENATVEVAIDPTRFPGIIGQTCDIYVVEAKTSAQWAADPSLLDVTAGGAQTESFGGSTIQDNTFQVAGPFELNADAGTDLGVGYDVVLDCDQDGLLSDGDFIDGLSNEAGLYVVHDTTAPGPLAVTEVLYSIAPGIGASFGIPATKLAEDLYYPNDIASMGELPIIIVSHGNGHDYTWYDHIGFHMASYGYIVMSHDNNTVPGVESAATTTLGHTDAFIDQADTGVIAGGALVGHLDTSRITWIGHSRGGEGVAIAYDRLFDNTHTATHYSRGDIVLISSMLPTDYQGTNITNPHNANYHLWTASGDSDVSWGTFHIHDRATHYRQSTVVQGTGHAWFHDGPESPDWFDGPCSIGPTHDLTHLIQLGHFLPLIKHYVEGNIPALDFLTRQYEDFHPIGVPVETNSCIVVSHEYRNGADQGNYFIDDYQTQTGTGTSSSGGAVTFDVENLTEGRLDDNNSDFIWDGTDPFNGATQAGSMDSSRGVVFDWTAENRFYEWEVIPGQRDFSEYLYLSLRGAQATQHPNTRAVLGDLTFSVTLRDGDGTSSSINIGAYGGGLEQPYERSGGWHNEMETVRIRITDFLNNGSGLNPTDIVAVRLDVGHSWGSNEGRIVVDELMLTNDFPPFAPVCEANGPYVEECAGTTTDIQLDGSGSSDPDPGDVLSFMWSTDSPGNVFDDPTLEMPTLSVVSVAPCPLTCSVTLTVTDNKGHSDTCDTTFTIEDTTSPTLTCPPDMTIECDASTEPTNTGHATATDACDSSPVVTFSDVTTPGTCPAEFTITRTWTATDYCGNTSSCVQTINVVDTTPPVISCNAPSTIIPPDAPISFTATATDNCDDSPSVEITEFDCFKYTKKGKRIDKTESCVVSIENDTITILDSGGVGTHITWMSHATDSCGNVAEKPCKTLVVNPAQ